MFGTAPVQFVQSLVSVLPKLPEFFEPYFVSTVGGYIPENRNALVQKFIELEKAVGEMDYVLWLDSDIEFDIRDVRELANAIEEYHVNILSGVSYAMRPDRTVFPLVMRKQENGDYWNVDNGELYGVKEFDSASLGFVMMRGLVLRTMIEKLGPRLFHFSERNGKFVGEDNLFFENAKWAGFDLCVKGSVVVKHIKLVGILPGEE